MKITDCLCPEAITVELKANEKKAVIIELTELLRKANKIKDTAEIVDVLMLREKIGSTGIGQGVAIPHGKHDALKEQVAALGISKAGIEFESMDGKPVHIFFLLLCPPESGGEHLKAMAGISRIMKDKNMRESLCKAQSAGELLSFIRQRDV